MPSKLNKSALLGFLDDIQRGIECFIAEVDEQINNMNEEEYGMDAAALRNAQAKLARTKADLDTLWRRLDT